ncbi:hypothetical protein DYST_04526 [Dyella terrae]|nr:hypothetical protein DYST_04526 [Dyella terrae]
MNGRATNSGDLAEKTQNIARFTFVEIVTALLRTYADVQCQLAFVYHT